MATLTASERIDLVEEAREHLNEAIRCLKRAFPGDGYVQAYIIDHLRIQAGSGHGFLSNDPNMDDLIEMIGESGEVEADDEAEDAEDDEDEWDAEAGGWEGGYDRRDCDYWDSAGEAEEVMAE